MHTRRTLHLIAALMILVALSFGCAKEVGKTPGPSDGDGGGMSEAEIAARELAEAKRMLVNEKIYFAYDSSALTEEAKAILARKAGVLKENPNLRVLIEGHCDERGTEIYNLALGERRARSVQKYLTLLGVVSTQLETISYGEERPAAAGHDESAWKQNRRCEFKVVW